MTNHSEYTHSASVFKERDINIICMLNCSNIMFRVPLFFKERDISITYILNRSEYMLRALVFKEQDLT